MKHSNAPPRRPEPEKPEYRDENSPPFRVGETVEVYKTRRDVRPAQCVRITRLWWGGETGNWCVVVLDPRTNKEFHAFADDFRRVDPVGAIGTLMPTASVQPPSPTTPVTPAPAPPAAPAQ